MLSWQIGGLLQTQRISLERDIGRNVHTFLIGNAI